MSQNFIIMIVANGVLAVFSYALNFMLTRYLPMESYGQLRYAISITSVLVFLTNPGLSAAIFKSVIDGYHNFVGLAYRLTIRHSLFGSFVILLLGLYYVLIKGQGITGGLILIGALFFPVMYLDRWIMVYMARALFARARANEIFVKLLSIILAAAAAFLTGNVFIVMISMFIAYMVFNPLLCLRSLKVLKYGAESPGSNQDYRSYANRLTRYTIMPTAVKHLDKIIIANFMGFNELSIYYIATIIPSYLLASLKSGFNVPIQKWVGFGKREALGIFRKNQWLILLASLVVSAGLYLVIPYVLMIFGQDYAAADGYARILCLSFLFYPYSTLFFTSTKYLGDERFIGRTINIQASIKTASYFIVVPLWGIAGLVWTQVLLEFSMFTVAVVRLYSLKRKSIEERTYLESDSSADNKALIPDSLLPDGGISSEDPVDSN